MAIDPERGAEVRAALEQASLDAFVCWSPTEVLLLTGYWPVMGASVAIFPVHGIVTVIAPEDEAHIVKRSSTAACIPYRPGTLDRITTPLAALTQPLLSTLQSMGLQEKSIAVEMQQGMQPASYAASVEFRGAMEDLLRRLPLGLRLSPGERLLEPLKAKKTTIELEAMRRAARIAASGFIRAQSCIEANMRESEIAAAVQYAFEASPEAEGVERSYGFYYCMSGPNSAEASGAYARTRQRRVQDGDLVLIHANTCADGYWMDITRTYTVGSPSDRQRKMRAAIEEARAAALEVIRPGALARDVDRAARAVMERHGMGEAFRHSTGHGVGFAAANPNGLPRIHPQSPDVLQAGMTFNVEPAAYFDGYGGMRHCDVVAVTESGVEVLTDF